VRIAHLADPHLGIRQYHRQTASGLNQREADVGKAFRSAVDAVIEARPDVVLVAGDLFHSVRPGNAAIVFAFQQFQRLRTALPDARVILIAGNHDTPRSAETGSIFGLFAELGVHVAAQDLRRFHFPELDLEVLAVPHAALSSEPRPELRPTMGASHRVLLLHGEISGTFAGARELQEYGGAAVSEAELGADTWSYVALGHYHVQRPVAPRAWYAGSLDYVSSNPWGELHEEHSLGLAGKGWLLADLSAGTVEAHPIAAPRRFVDLDPVAGAHLGAAELDAAIAARLASVEGGLRDAVVRLVVHDVPRHVARMLDHTALRAFRAEALHLQLDIRRPEVRREVGVGAPGTRQTLPDIVRQYLERRVLSAEVDREEFVRTGADLVASAEREIAGE
jgi:DNA repair exonuclease SbcCD nuclease subunit